MFKPGELVMNCHTMRYCYVLESSKESSVYIDACVEQMLCGMAAYKNAKEAMILYRRNDHA